MISEKRVMIAVEVWVAQTIMIFRYTEIMSKPPMVHGKTATKQMKQFMWENGGERLHTVNPELLTPAENEGQKFYTFKANPVKRRLLSVTWLVE